MITLRPLKSHDLEHFWIWASDDEVTQPLFWDSYQSKEAALKFLINVADSHPFFMAICLNHIPIGAITLDQVHARGSIRAELGYVLAKKYWGLGLTTQATQLALKLGFEIFGLKRIEALVDPANKASIRVLEKSGLQNEGYFKNYVVHRGHIKDRMIYAATK